MTADNQNNLEAIAALQQSRRQQAYVSPAQSIAIKSRRKGPQIICPNPNCRYVGPSRKQAKGSLLVLLLLALLFVLPALLYMIFYSGHDILCPRCGMKVRG